MNTPQVTCIGLGSPYGDDQIAWLVIDKLSEMIEHHSEHGIKLIRLDRSGAQLLELLSSSHKTIIIDATASSAKAGTLHHFNKQQLLQRLDDGFLLPSSHSLGLAAALALGETMGELPADLEFYGIELARLPRINDFDHAPDTRLIAASSELATLLDDRFIHSKRWVN